MTSMIDSLPIEIQARDIALLRGLFEARVMTLGHATTLYFNNKYEMAKKRLQKLKAAGLVRERSRRVYEPSILFLTKKAFTLLCQGDHISEYPRFTWEKLEGRVAVSNLTLRHELEVMDVKAGFVTATSGYPTLRITEFTTWPQMNSFNTFHPATGAKLTVKPDGFIRMRETDPNDNANEHMFFLELDRSTEALDILATRALSYLNFYKSGGIAVRLGAERNTFKEFPFRVLIVCKSAERRNNIAVKLLSTNPPIRTFVWLTTLAEVTANPLGPIWITPAALSDAETSSHKVPLIGLDDMK